MLGLVVKGVPGIIVVGREHVIGLHTTDEIVMPIEVEAAVDLNKPGATTGATGHIAGDRDNSAAPMLPAFAGRSLAGLSGLTIERISCWIAISVEGLIDRLIIGPTSTAYRVGQVALAIRSNDGHAKVMMKVIWLGIYPVGRDL